MGFFGKMFGGGDIGGAWFRLGLDDTQLTEGMRRAEETTSSSVGRMGGKFAALARGAGFAAVALALREIANAGRAALQAIDAVNEALNTSVREQARSSMTDIQKDMDAVEAKFDKLLNTLRKEQGLPELFGGREQRAAERRTLEQLESEKQDIREKYAAEDRRRAMEAASEDQKVAHDYLEKLWEAQDKRWEEERRNAELMDELHNRSVQERIDRENELLRILRSQTAEFIRQADAFQDLQSRQTAAFNFGQLNATMTAVLDSVNRISGNIPSGR